MSCEFEPTIGFYQTNGSCTYTAGEHWIEYTVTVPAGSGTTPLVVDTTSNIYTGGPSQRAKTSFSTGSGAPRRLHYLLARDGGGRCSGTGGTARTRWPATGP